MSCIGLGIDIIEVERFSNILKKRGDRFIRRLFTPLERDYCEKSSSRVEAFSERFAAKEAFLKALGRGLRGGIRWIEIEVVIDHLKQPGLRITGKARDVADALDARNFLLSVSRSNGSVVAVVVIED